MFGYSNMSWKTRTTQCDPLKASYCLPKSHATQASKLAVQDPRKSSCGVHWKAGHIPKINNVLEIAGGLACAKVNKILKIHKGVPKSPNHGRHSPQPPSGGQSGSTMSLCGPHGRLPTVTVGKRPEDPDSVPKCLYHWQDWGLGVWG